MPIAALVIAGFCARTLGVAEYGLMAVALTISSLSSVIVPAIAVTTTKFISHYRGSAVTHECALARTLSASLLSVLMFDVVLMGAVFVFSETLSKVMFGTAVLNRSGISHVLLLAFLAVCNQQLDGVFAAVLKGLERFKEQAIYEAATKFLLVISVIWVTLQFRSVEAILVVYSAFFFVSTIGRAGIVRMAMPNRSIFSRPTYTDITRLISFGGWMWLTAISGATVFTVDRIVVGRVIGLSAAGELALYTQLAQLCHFVPNSVFAFIFPLFSKLAAGGAEKASELRRQYAAYEKAITGMAILLALIIFVVGGAAIKLVTGATPQFVDNRSFAILVVAFAGLAPAIAPYYLLLAVGRPRRVSTTVAFSACGMLLLIIVFVPVWGVFGAALARLAYVFGVFTLFGPARFVLGKAACRRPLEKVG